MNKKLLSLLYIISLLLTITTVFTFSNALEKNSVITLDESKKITSIEDSTLSTKELPLRVWLQKQYAMEITNITNTSIQLDCNGSTDKSYDYVIYNADKTIDSSDFNRYYPIHLGPGQSLQVNINTGTGLYFDVPPTISSTVRKLFQPALTKVTIQPGEFFEFTNSYNESIVGFNTGDYKNFDYVSYNELGKISTYYEATSQQIQFYNTNRIKIAPSDDYPLTISLPSDLPLNISRHKGKILSKLPLKSQETLEFTNPNNDSLTINTYLSTQNPEKIDIISYNPDGSVNSYFPKSTNKSILINKGCRVKVTLIEGTSSEFCSPIETTPNYTYSKTKAFERIVLKNGESIKINKGTTNKTMFDYENSHPYTSSFDIVVNSSIGVESIKTNDSGLSTTLIEGNNYHFTLKRGDNITLFFPSEYKPFLEKTQVPSLKEVSLLKGESYEFTNKDVDQLYISQLIPGATFDYISITNGVNVDSAFKDSLDGGFKVIKNSNVKITPTSAKGVILHVPSFIDGTHKKAITPVFTEFVVPANKTLVMINNSNLYTSTFLTNSKLSNSIRYDSTYHDINGDVFYSIHDNYGDCGMNFKLNYKFRLKQSKGDSPLIVYIPSENATSVTLSDKPVFKEEVVLGGSVYKIKNTVGNSMITTSSKDTTDYFNVLIYDSLGNVKEQIRKSNRDFEIKSGYTAEFTPLNSSTTLYIPYQIVDENKVSPLNADVNFDNVIDILDLTLTAKDYNVNSTSPTFNKNLDVISDNIIDIYDLCYIGRYINMYTK